MVFEFLTASKVEAIVEKYLKVFDSIVVSKWDPVTLLLFSRVDSEMFLIVSDLKVVTFCFLLVGSCCEKLNCRLVLDWELRAVSLVRILVISVFNVLYDSAAYR